jgi:hypothetical protein
MRPWSVVWVEMTRHQAPEAQSSDLLRSLDSPALDQIRVDPIENAPAKMLLGGRVAFQLVELIPLEISLKVEITLPAELPTGMGVGMVEVPHVHPQRFDLDCSALLLVRITQREGTDVEVVDRAIVRVEELLHAVEVGLHGRRCLRTMAKHRDAHGDRRQERPAAALNYLGTHLLFELRFPPFSPLFRHSALPPPQRRPREMEMEGPVDVTHRLEAVG